MNITNIKSFLLLFILLSFNITYGQVTNACAWIDEIQAEKEIADQLRILQDHFRGSCEMFVVVNGHPVSELTSSFYFSDPEKFIKEIRPEEIKYIYVANQKESQILYSNNRVILISLIEEDLMNAIRKRLK